MSVVSASTPATTTPTASTTGSGTSSVVGQPLIAQNFDTFLQLLTTQLKNQNPLDPLDTNQFTQQLVQFAQVEQQMKQNNSLATLISLEKATQTTAALSFLGSSVVVDGNTAALANGQATWSFSSDKTASAVINIQDSNGQAVYSENRTVNAGPQDFNWNGRNANGQMMPDGNYTISITAKDASGNSAAIATEVQGVVDGIDLNQTPPVLKIGGNSFTLDKIKQVIRKGS
jgi:flagellar basal-body rod modification protein FlgD